MLAATSKACSTAWPASALLRRLASRYGMAPGHGFARRFIAGESVEEAIAAARDAAAPSGFGVSLDYLGESVATLEAGRRGHARLPAPSSTASWRRAWSATCR